MRAVTGWPSQRLQELFSIEIPIVQAPMAGANLSAMVIAVSEAGGLGSLPCSMLSPEGVREELDAIRRRTQKPINLDFSCHRPPKGGCRCEARWLQRLAPTVAELGVDPQAVQNVPVRAPFDDALFTRCRRVQAAGRQLSRRAAGRAAPGACQEVGAKVISSATTVGEARWLEQHGCDRSSRRGSKPADIAACS